MILKLVYNKEIHVYDLKSNQTLEHLILKIRELFKRVPPQFTLCYKNAQQQQTTLETNQEFDKLIDSLKSDTKMFKIFINEVNRQECPTETKSEQKLETGSSEQFGEMTQVIECSKQLDEICQNFGNTCQIHEKIAQSQYAPLLESENQHSKQSPIMKEFQILSNEKVEIDHDTMLQREQPSERQLNVNDEEISNPHELRISTSNKGEIQKQNLTQARPETNQVAKPHIWELSQNLKNPNTQINAQIKPPHKNQNVEPMLPPNLGDVEQPPIEKEVEDDFKTHNIRCDICNGFPICGARYKCVICKDYDLCQNCQTKYEHEHPLLKIVYSFQTPTRIQVQIPEFRFGAKTQKKEQKVYPTFDVSQLSMQQRNERVLSIASQISQLLGKDLKECYQFVRQNQEYSKQTLVEFMIEGRRPFYRVDQPQHEKKQQKPPVGLLQGIKGFIFGKQDRKR